MRQQHKGLQQGLRQLIDIGIIAVCYLLAFNTKIALPGRFGGLTVENNYDFILLICLVSFHFSLKFWDYYHPPENQKLAVFLRQLCKAALTAILSVIFLCYLLHVPSVSRLFILIFSAYSVLSLAAFRIILHRWATKSRTSGYNIRKILIIGSRQRAIDFIKKVHESESRRYQIIGCLETIENKASVGDTVYGSVKVIGTLDQFRTLLTEKTVDEIVFGLPLRKVLFVHEYIYFAEEIGKNIRVLPDFQINKIKYLPRTARMEIEEFMGMTTLSLSSTPGNENSLQIKSFIDYTGALCGIIVLSPLLLIIAILIKLTSRGPVIFSQKRAGLNGRHFHVHKFRTMVVNAEELREQLLEKNEEDGPVFKIEKDPRITAVGTFLRKTSMDELPQLFNVLKGEMSLVGPRPPIPEEVGKYQLWQRRRLSMKPGLTCIWQVSGRNKVSFEEWMNMDLQYIDNWSWKLDFKLILLTIRAVFTGSGR